MHHIDLAGLQLCLALVHLYRDRHLRCRGVCKQYSLPLYLQLGLDLTLCSCCHPVTKADLPVLRFRICEQLVCPHHAGCLPRKGHWPQRQHWQYTAPISAASWPGTSGKAVGVLINLALAPVHAVLWHVAVGPPELGQEGSQALMAGQVPRLAMQLVHHECCALPPQTCRRMADVRAAAPAQRNSR